MPLGTIHSTKLPDVPPDDPLYGEWNFIRRQLPRLLAEGHEGKWAVVKREEIVALYPTEREALTAGHTTFPLQHFLVQPIRTWEPLLQTSPYCWACRTCASPRARTVQLSRSWLPWAPTDCLKMLTPLACFATTPNTAVRRTREAELLPAPVSPSALAPC
jgi:hypothetical protein